MLNLKLSSKRKYLSELFGFTLAEIMVVLTVIGILTAVLLPIVANSTPDKNVMKFKKADTTFKNVIRELVTSDKYFEDGDLGKRIDNVTIGVVPLDSPEYNGEYSTSGEVCNSNYESINNLGLCNIQQYVCNAMADILSTKEVNCPTVWHRRNYGYEIIGGGMPSSATEVRNVTAQDYINSKKTIDKRCKEYAKDSGRQIVASDGTVYYESNSTSSFQSYWAALGNRFYSAPGQHPPTIGDQNGFDIAYHIFCIDIDDFDKTKGSADCDDVKDICPFGYGVRADGKILPGERAEKWLAKDFQGKDPSEQN